LASRYVEQTSVTLRLALNNRLTSYETGRLAWGGRSLSVGGCIAINEVDCASAVIVRRLSDSLSFRLSHRPGMTTRVSAVIFLLWLICSLIDCVVDRLGFHDGVTVWSKPLMYGHFLLQWYFSN